MNQLLKVQVLRITLLLASLLKLWHQVPESRTQEAHQQPPLSHSHSATVLRNVSHLYASSSSSLIASWWGGGREGRVQRQNYNTVWRKTDYDKKWWCKTITPNWRVSNITTISKTQIKLLQISQFTNIYSYLNNFYSFIKIKHIKNITIIMKKVLKYAYDQ